MYKRQLLIARLELPALIVTLGTFSLFRGIAEGVTEGAVNYTGFPSRFLFLGQGYLGGVIPAQLPVFVAIAAAYFDAREVLPRLVEQAMASPPPAARTRPSEVAP